MLIDKVFGLSAAESSVYLSLINLVIENDISLTTDNLLRKKKEFWRLKFLEGVTLEKSMLQKLYIEENKTKLIKLLATVPFPKRYVMFFECFLFKPYFELNIRHELLNGLKKEPLNLVSEKHQKNFLLVICAKSKVNKEEILNSIKRFNDVVKDIKYANSKVSRYFNLWTIGLAGAVLAAVMAPPLGAAIGGLMGLSGAAATSAGLAWIGIGSIASGGFGMAGGLFVVIGGGGVLGAVVGNIPFFKIINANSSLVLNQVSKIETIIECFCGKDSSTKDLIEKIIADYKKSRETIKAILWELEDKLDDAVAESSETEQTMIKNLKESREYYETAMKRLRLCQAAIDSHQS